MTQDSDKIKFLVMDVDGTLTDGKIYMGESGEVFKAFDIKDGYGIHEMLPRHGIIPVVITARESRIVDNRCQELGIEEVHQGKRNKLGCLEAVMEKYSMLDSAQYSFSNVAYIGDDMMDLQCMKMVGKGGGILGCPADAIKEVMDASHFIATKKGGAGAVREFITFLVGKNE